MKIIMIIIIVIKKYNDSNENNNNDNKNIIIITMYVDVWAESRSSRCLSNKTYFGAYSTTRKVELIQQ